MGGDVTLEGVVLFRESRSASTKAVLDSSRSGVHSIESGSDFDARRAERSKRRSSKKKRRFANWPRRSTNKKTRSANWR